MKTLKPLFATLFATMLCIVPLFGQRVKYTVNESWRFSSTAGTDAISTTYDDSQWDIIHIPHTWNNLDCKDEVPGYRRGTGWYRRTIAVQNPYENGRTYLFFEGANQTTDLYVNGQKAGHHEGGYTAFCFDITSLIVPGDNLFAICVDNSHNPDIPPLSADFTFFGGIYRDVYLIYTPAIHISTTHYASSGVYVSTPEADTDHARIEIRSLLDNGTPDKAKATLENRIIDSEGREVATDIASVKLPADAKHFPVTVSLDLPSPKLWDIDSPNLYLVRTRLLDSDGNVLDCVVNPLGIRSFRFSPDEGFFLNGRHVKLMGTNRHQDYLDLGNALRDEMHVRDIKLLRDMGGNFLRISHYPQDPVIMEMCDKSGIVSSVEIPVVNAVTLSDAFKENCLNMTREMIYQSYNSPSVIMWTYMNEVMLRPPYGSNDSQQTKETYARGLYDIASAIENEIRSIDPSRYTMLPCHSNSKVYIETGIASLPRILGWNLYNGWYGNSFDGFEKTLDKLHALFPEQSIIVTEYGADTDPRLHSFDSERFDFTCEYGNRYHEHYIPQILARDFVAGTTIWNLNDFFSESRGDAVPKVNNKGITGTDRERKDIYHLYRTYLLDQPVVYICGATWETRGGSGNGFCTQPVRIYTNLEQVELIHNDQSLGTLPVTGHAVSFDVPFTDGKNRLEAIATTPDGKKIRDFFSCDFHLTPDRFNGAAPFEEMNVMLGSRRFFEDRTAEMIWIPEQAYKPGSWGYVGGDSFRTKTRHGSLPASNIDILGTGDDPIFQTQRVGIESFRADVPDGLYSIYLYLAELTSDTQREQVAYNLGNDAIASGAIERVFDVTINGTPVLRSFNLARECGAERAVIKKFVVEVSDGKGLNIVFTPHKGEPILNAIRIYRNY